jgi:hypothetical protein
MGRGAASSGWGRRELRVRAPVGRCAPRIYDASQHSKSNMPKNGSKVSWGLVETSLLCFHLVV